MELREQIARAIHGQCDRDLDASWSDWLPEADAVLGVLRHQTPVAYIMRCSNNIVEATIGASVLPADYSAVKHFTGDMPLSQAVPLYAAPGARAAVPDGWLRATDEEMVGAHIGVADASDDYAAAKEKLNRLICWHVAAATDPTVNGGWQLVPIEPTEEMLARTSAPGCAASDWAKMIAAAPKPEGK